MRYPFVELPGRPAFARPAIPVQVEDLVEAPQLCLVDSGAQANRFGLWLAELTGIDLSGAPQEQIGVGGTVVTARHARCELTIAGTRYDAPVSFCDPWPFAFNLLGQDGFLRFFRITMCAAHGWLDVTAESEMDGE